ncbi:acyl-CoA desaturase [Pontivivens insulae]|uniref:Fatty acid desaturase domain-containing protein n=1 Tax=Pontivivens insulae TaxID=1639689 RepID=A0A2R8AFN4_9RHOB|nr:acyl-CoA desaturase [Pontivivens insulae]RED12134.1 stearoyl-CoA desaturase (delta-9 desaturase) [Pontivivens insulae]SPF30890.1 hypothetical protein POI8812_03235 [Pontivivens insulae]
MDHISAKLVSTDRFTVTAQTNNLNGQIIFEPIKAFWLVMHGVFGAIGLFVYPSPGALAVFVVLTTVTICAGHSVGMHRLLIHRSFKTSRPIEYGLVWLGTLVGMAGPIGMIRTHDLRDWHQRQTTCPKHPAHDAGILKDAWWQLCCELRLTSPPEFHLEERIKRDRFYTFVERYWMAQQLPLAAALFTVGGLGWVLWGCSLRIFVSLVGHWAVGHFAHRQGKRGWIVQGLPVQGYNLPGLGLITFGENWHGNHHAFPHSAQLGVEPGQTDPGFTFIKTLARFSLAWDIKHPGSEAARSGLRRAGTEK